MQNRRKKVSFKINPVPMCQRTLRPWRVTKHNNKQQIAQELVENTGKFILKTSYFLYKEKDNWKILFVV